MRAAIVTGADHGYFPLMHALLTTLGGSSAEPPFPLVVLDFGMEPEEVAAAKAMAARVVRPDWWFDAPAALRVPRNLGYAARPMIPNYFPGYDAYLWLDADISVRDDRFVLDFLRAAFDGTLAIVEEADPSYRAELYALKWRLGNAFRCFGPRDGLRICLGRQINSGAFALRADAPHWSAWRRHYRNAVTRAGRANLDQHALMATLHLEGLPATYLDSTHNWICARSQPIWDDQRRVFCRPLPPFEPISVLHLAGRQKHGTREIGLIGGGTRSMPLSYAGLGDVSVQADLGSLALPLPTMATESPQPSAVSSAMR
ncbi:MAG: hypothetical protein ACR2RA_11060 [Geminicoccaceae bacterium]